jgi:phospholipase C
VKQRPDAEARRRRLSVRFGALALLTAGTILACSSGRSASPPKPTSSSASTTVQGTTGTGIHKIEHVIVIMQENRSFDSYFGTYPGAEGLPASNGKFTVCSPNPLTHACDAPYHDPADINGGAAHTSAAATADINGGKMDGFVARAQSSNRGCSVAQNPACANSATPDVMGYHDAREIPNYWAYAQNFTLNDHMFEPVASWSLPDHLYLVSGWSARCTSDDPSTCTNNIVGPYTPAQQQRAVRQAIATGTAPIKDAWTDITYLLHQHHVSWGYFVEDGTEPDCIDDATACPPRPQNYRTPGIWNPLPLFTDVQQDGELANIEPTSKFFDQAKTGQLPAVSWIAPSQVNSEHPPASVAEGQAWVTNLVNAVMNGPDWSSSAIFVSWDDWGGFYDHVVPPTVDGNGYGLRVPGLVISPYAKKGHIDHQILSHDAYLKFIEDDFLDGARLDPATDGRPDPRPDVRENANQLGDLTGDFDFTQPPRAPLALPVKPNPGPATG